jgi:hypothetical protein
MCGWLCRCVRTPRRSGQAHAWTEETDPSSSLERTLLYHWSGGGETWQNCAVRATNWGLLAPQRVKAIAVERLQAGDGRQPVGEAAQAMLGVRGPAVCLFG